MVLSPRRRHYVELGRLTPLCNRASKRGGFGRPFCFHAEQLIA
jgi:hypothetical protein